MKIHKVDTLILVYCWFLGHKRPSVFQHMFIKSGYSALPTDTNFQINFSPNCLSITLTSFITNG